MALPPLTPTCGASSDGFSTDLTVRELIVAWHGNATARPKAGQILLSLQLAQQQLSLDETTESHL